MIIHAFLKNLKGSKFLLIDSCRKLTGLSKYDTVQLDLIFLAKLWTSLQRLVQDQWNMLSPWKLLQLCCCKFQQSSPLQKLWKMINSYFFLLFLSWIFGEEQLSTKAIFSNIPTFAIRKLHQIPGQIQD